jgi:hypothetical protein
VAVPPVRFERTLDGFLNWQRGVGYVSDLCGRTICLNRRIRGTRRWQFMPTAMPIRSATIMTNGCLFTPYGPDDAALATASALHPFP